MRLFSTHKTLLQTTSTIHHHKTIYYKPLTIYHKTIHYSPQTIHYSPNHSPHKYHSMTKMLPLLRQSLLLFVLLSFWHPAFSQGYLRAEGNKITDGNGKEVLLRGIGLGGWTLQEPYMIKLSGIAVNQQDIRAKISKLIGAERTKQFYDEWLKDGMQRSDIDSLAAWGFNSIRLPMHYNLFTLPAEKEPVTGKDTWLEKGFELTDSLLSWCKADHIYLILDLHAAPGGQGHDLPIADRDSTTASLWQSQANREKTIALWKKLAERYKDEEWIGCYDLLNEPNWSFDDPDNSSNHGCADKDNAPLKQLYKDITQAIRSVDKHHLIIVEGNCWANNHNGLFPLWDDNMMVSFHKYWNKNDVASIQKYLDIRETYHVPLWLGESGENNNKWFHDAVQLMESNDIGWSWWPLKKIGQSNPFEVKMPPAYQQLVNYWKGRGTRPSAEEAYRALLQLAKNYRTENLIVHHDVLSALFGQK